MNKISTLSFTFLALLLSHSSSAQLPAAYTDRLQFVLDSVCDARNIKGASASVVVPDLGIWEGVHGVSHAGTPIHPSMFLGLGSNTKTYVAAAMLKLQEAGTLDLDDTVGTWIDHPNINGEITIRQLLNHTSGLYNYTNSQAWSNAVFTDMEAFWDPEDLLQYVGPQNFNPGASWDYSNSNFLVAGLIIEEVTGQTLSDHISTAILVPAGLDSTVLYTMGSENLNIPHIWSDAISQDNLEDLIVDYAYSHNSMMTAAWAAGGMLATAKDNALFWSKLFAGDIISEASWAEMTTVVPLNSNLGYGLGIFRENNVNGATIYSHGGTNLGFINENLVDINTGVAVSVLTNQDSIGNAIIFDRVVAELHAVTLVPNIGIQERPELSFFIHPNPATDQVFVNVANSSEATNVSVLSITGKLLLTDRLSSDRNVLRVNDLPSGTYLLQVQNGDRIGMQKLVIVR
jgi:D-alanyl-D-alanine carboxypeptidase